MMSNRKKMEEGYEKDIIFCNERMTDMNGNEFVDVWVRSVALPSVNAHVEHEVQLRKKERRERKEIKTVGNGVINK